MAFKKASIVCGDKEFYKNRIEYNCDAVLGNKKYGVKIENWNPLAPIIDSKTFYVSSDQQCNKNEERKCHSYLIRNDNGKFQWKIEDIIYGYKSKSLANVEYKNVSSKEASVLKNIMNFISERVMNEEKKQINFKLSRNTLSKKHYIH